jgi:hypothetical protein
VAGEFVNKTEYELEVHRMRIPALKNFEPELQIPVHASRSSLGF